MVDATPVQIAEAKLDQWYYELSSQDRVRVRRYLEGIDTSSDVAFLIDLMKRASDDHNYKLAVTAGEALEQRDLDDVSRFNATEGYIEGLFGSDNFDLAKEMCCRNLELYPNISDALKVDGMPPAHLSCRNRLIDILVGVEGSYDEAYSVLDQYVMMGLIDEEERDYRKQSLKIHRMQRSFDNIFNYRRSE